MTLNFGAWKYEGTATRARFLRQKCYIEEIDKKLLVTCSGLPPKCHIYVNWDNFKVGFTCGGKLRYTHVKGGIILKETEFTIKDDTVIKNLAKFNKK